MKSFSLICEQAHEFDLMVKSADALEAQQARGLVTCPYCHSDQVQRTLARPAVKGGKDRGAPKGQGTTSIDVSHCGTDEGTSRRAEFEKAYKFFSQMRAKVEKTHENVGEKFTEQARAMHYGEIEERGIYGKASHDQVKELIDEGGGVAPLPDLPKENA